jgi:protein-histidine pros-kinase
MKLLVKFNLIFVFAFGVGLVVAAYVSHLIVQRNAREQVLQQARLMMETALATRSYTSTQVAPLLKSQRYQLQSVLDEMTKSVDSTTGATLPLDSPGLTDQQKTDIQASFQQALTAVHDKAVGAMSAVPKDNPNEVFNPQTVPAYAATEIFNFLRKKYPEYSYKEATLNPTNPRDRTTDWEADVVNEFRNDDKKTELYGERESATGRALYLARPIKITMASCLDCHSTPDKAPPAMIKQYGSANGFDWHLNDTVGVQLVQVPMSLPVKMGNEAFATLLGSLVGVFLLTLVILNIVLHVTVIRPVGKLSRMADEVSAGRVDVAEFHVKGKDEISILATAFNRMQRSLVRALKMLDE